MDTSGSMGWHRSGSAIDLNGGCCSRLASAKLAAKEFINRLNTFASDSRLGVAIFPAAPAPASNPEDYGDRFAPSSNLADSSIFPGIETAIGGEANSPCGNCSTIPASRINAYLSVELLLGCHYFFEDSLGDEFYWLNTSLNGKISIPLGAVKPFVNGGGGYYLLESGDIYPGWNIGGGLAFVIHPKFEIELGYNYHNVSHTLNNEFSVGQLGIRVGF
jgi:hypothetical protein